MIVKIKDICDTISETFDFNQPEIHFLNTGDILEGHIINDLIYKKEELKGQAKKSIKNNDILFSEIRPKNKHYAIVNLKHPEKYVVSTKLMVIRIKSKVDINLKYFYYCITNENFLNKLQRKAENRIGSFPQITFEVLSNFELDLPPRHIQDKIAEILSNIDNQIERNNTMVKRLQDLASTTYSRWFNQFEFPNKNGLPYKSNGGEFVYNEKLKRNIPVGWEVTKMSNVFDFLEGPGITKDKYSNKGQNFINIKCLENNFINTNSCSKINEIYLDEYKKYQLEKEDILISTSGTLGTIGIVTSANLPLLLNTSIIRFRPILNNCFGYMYSYLTSKLFNDLLYQSATGSIQKNVGPTHLEQFNILVPKEYIIKEYNEIIYPIFKEICLINEQNIELNNLKSKLLPLLINGQLEV